MATKIDLLPAYVKLRRDLNRSIAGCIVASGLVLGGLLLVYHQRQLDLETAKADLAAVAAVRTLADNATGELTAATTEAAPVLTRVNFMLAASKTGPQRAALIDLVRKSIYSDAIVSSIDISDGQNVTIKATVRNTDEYATFLLNLRNASDANGGVLFKGLPVASGPGGFANGAVPFLPPIADGTQATVPYVYPINVTAQGVLLNPIQIPPDPVGGAAAGAPGAPGIPGGPPPGFTPPGPPPGAGGPPPGFVPPGPPPGAAATGR